MVKYATITVGAVVPYTRETNESIGWTHPPTRVFLPSLLITILLANFICNPPYSDACAGRFVPININSSVPKFFPTGKKDTRHNVSLHA